MVNVVHDFLCMRLTMRSNEVLLDPRNKVIFERTFDHLVEKIGRKELMNVRSGEVIGERLPKEEVSTASVVNNNMVAEVESDGQWA
jgi:hypothetical protein